MSINPTFYFLFIWFNEFIHITIKPLIIRHHCLCFIFWIRALSKTRYRPRLRYRLPWCGDQYTSAISRDSRVMGTCGKCWLISTCASSSCCVLCFDVAQSTQAARAVKPPCDRDHHADKPASAQRWSARIRAYTHTDRAPGHTHAHRSRAHGLIAQIPSGPL